MFDIRITGIAETAAALQAAGQIVGMQTGFLKPAWEKIGKLQLAEIQRNFSEQGRLAQPGGWKKLSPATVLWSQQGVGGPVEKIYDNADLKAKHGYKGILFESGQLYHSFEKGRPFNIFNVFPHGVEVGSGDPKASLHQTGHNAVFRYSQVRMDRIAHKKLSDGSWNRQYFKWQIMLRKMDNKSYHVPARPMIFKSDYMISRYTAILEAQIRYRLGLLAPLRAVRSVVGMGAGALP